MIEPDSSRQVARSIEEFYDLLAPDYDAMTSIGNRFANELPFFRALVDHYHIQTACDAGCGSGFHSVLLSQLGIEVLGIDVSSEMLRMAEKNMRLYGVAFRTQQISFEDLNRLGTERFDSVFVMGNSLAHMHTHAQLEDAVKNLASILRPDGLLVVQVLNYDRIVPRQERLLSERQAGDKTFVRSYDYGGDAIDFTVLTREQKDGAPKETSHTIRLRPVFHSELLPLLAATGFNEIASFGGINRKPFDPAQSRDLIITAVKHS